MPSKLIAAAFVFLSLYWGFKGAAIHAAPASRASLPLVLPVAAGAASPFSSPLVTPSVSPSVSPVTEEAKALSAVTQLPAATGSEAQPVVAAAEPVEMPADLKEKVATLPLPVQYLIQLATTLPNR